MSNGMAGAKSILKGVFGYDDFWPLQEAIIAHLLEKRNALVVLPTGGGKSLCYQIPALIYEGLSIVISPLISLMKNQVDELQECGVAAVYLNSTLKPDEYRRHVEKLKANKVKLLYLSPEALLSPRTLALLSTMKVDCMAIDEAHCISEWGHDFRPEYRQLGGLRNLFKDAVCVALTATATRRVRDDIKNSLQIGATEEFVGSFNRPNLFLEVEPKIAPLEQITEFLKPYRNESGIIYCFSRKQTDHLHAFLHEKGYSVRPYHAGLSDEVRTENQDLFVKDDIQIIVATIAFGMGINKPNVRFVIHHDLPKSLETYYQEIGRAGRDGLPARCLMLFGYGDVRNVRYFIQQKTGQEQVIANVLLDTILGYAETELCRRVPLLEYFGEKPDRAACGMCDNCKIEKRDLSDITIPAQMFLSCVKRTGECFGAGHVVDILRGSKSIKVLQHEHDRLSTYGIGKAHSAKQWRHLARQFIRKGLVIQDLEHGSLKLTRKAWDVLRGEESVRGLLEKEVAVLDSRAEITGQYDPGLFELLRKKRKEIADRMNIPPYAVFHDRTLKEMATHLPQTKDDLSRIYGIGAAKLEKYGDVVLDIIRQHCRVHRIAERPDLP
ncbi:MAG: DNA helicase RecQ [Syntrophaceae bacterium]